MSVFTVNGTPILIQMRRYDGGVRVIMSGLKHPHLGPDPKYGGPEAKDSRLLPLAERFLQDLQTKLDLETKQLKAGYFSGAAKVTISDVKHKDENTIEQSFAVPVPGYEKHADQLLARIKDAIWVLGPALEKKAKEALAEPLPARDMMGQTADQNNAIAGQRAGQMAARDKEIETDLSNAIADKHDIAPEQAGRIAKTAIGLLQKRGLLRLHNRADEPLSPN